MFRSSAPRRVHLLTGLIPAAIGKLPTLLTPAQCQTAVAAYKEAEGIIAVPSTFVQALEMLSDAKGCRESKALFIESGDAFRLALLGHGVKEPLRRLQLHQAAMAAGYFVKAVDPHSIGKPADFVVGHYNFDMRRDLVLTRAVHQSVLEHKQTTEESEAVLTNLLLLERRIFGKKRLVPVGGYQYLALGVSLNEIKTEAELSRVLDLPPLKAVGNFVVTVRDDEKARCKITTVGCGDEADASIDTTPPTKYAKLEYPLSIPWPARPLTWRELLRERMLVWWTYVVAFYAAFFLVDEEILTFLGLIFSKWKQTQILKEEAEKSGGKIYIAQAKWARISSW